MLTDPHFWLGVLFGLFGGVVLFLTFATGEAEVEQEDGSTRTYYWPPWRRR